MPFFYPNKINDFWRVMGLIFHQDKDYFWNNDARCFDLPAIKAMLDREGIALWDIIGLLCHFSLITFGIK